MKKNRMTTNDMDTTSFSELYGLVKFLLKDLNEENTNEFFEICFFNDRTIDREKTISFFLKLVDTKIETASIDRAKEMIFEMENNISLFDRIIYKLSITSICLLETHWTLMTIAMKKCLGAGNAQKTITDFKQYVELLSDIESPQQIITHKKCITAFNTNANDYTYNNLEGLSDYLHRIRSNKQIKTRKKNLSRVLKKSKRIMQAYKLANNGLEDRIFSKGRYLVPDQLANRLRILFFNH